MSELEIVVIASTLFGFVGGVLTEKLVRRLK